MNAVQEAGVKKRGRKRAWIVLCSAFAAVILICAFALLSGRPTYQFLNGAYPMGTRLLMDDESPGSFQAVRLYRTATPVESVLSEARNELGEKDVWIEVTAGWFINVSKRLGVIISNECPVYARRDEGCRVGATFIEVTEPATSIDRIVDWVNRF